MRKLLFSFIAFLMLLFTPAAFAQHGGHGGGGSHGGGGHQGGNSGFHQGSGGSRRGGEPAQHQQHFNNNRGEYRYNRGNEARNRWDGRRFDNDYFRGHFGRDHGFYWGHCAWYGPRFYVGSRFWYGGAWFVIVDPVPDFWGDTDVYVDEIDGVYYLVNPLYGTRIVIDVVF
jgi:hypothetical protein